MSKKLARILEVITSPATGEIFIAPVCGTLETVILDGRWSHHTTWKKVTDAINNRIKNGILKQNVGYAVYKSTGHGLQLDYVQIPPEFKHLPSKWL